MRYFLPVMFAFALDASGCECKQTEPPSKEKKSVAIILSSDEHWKRQVGDVILRTDEAGRLINVLGHYPNTADLIPDFAGTESNKGSPCVIHLTLDDEATMRIKALEKSIAQIQSALDPKRQTTIFVHLKGISP